MGKVKQKSKKIAASMHSLHGLLCNLYIRQFATDFFPTFPTACGKPCGNCVKVLLFKAIQALLVWEKKLGAVENYLSSLFFKKIARPETFSLLHKLMIFVYFFQKPLDKKKVRKTLRISKELFEKLKKCSSGISPRLKAFMVAALTAEHSFTSALM